MKPFRHVLSRFTRETAPAPRAVERVRERIGPQPGDAEISKALLQHLPDPPRGAEARVRARLAQPRPVRGRAWQVGAGLAVAAAAAGFALVIARPDPGLEPVQAQLSAARQPAELAPTPHVALSYRGAGSLEGTQRAPHIRWESGTVSVEVEPERGVELVVSTAEARVSVVGTAFEVTRDALGTQVRVDHGQVQVVCAHGPTQLLSARAETTCLPTTAHGMLARARALQSAGAAPELLLSTAEQALERYPEPGPVRSELRLVRIEALTVLGREAEALEQARAYLEAGKELRRDSVLALAARLAWTTGGCDAASSWLEQLAELQPSVPNLVRLADCRAPVDPAGARAVLEQAQALEPDERWASAIEQRLGRL
jgi:ferric-dicitrate binding protein FerR (iron transport regulator)